MISPVEDKSAEVAAACRRHGVEQLDLFGSAAVGNFDPGSSDLDFIVSFERREPPDLFERYFSLKEDRTPSTKSCLPSFSTVGLLSWWAGWDGPHVLGGYAEWCLPPYTTRQALSADG